SEGGYRAFQQLLGLHRRPTAVFAGNDLMAIGSLCAASEAGLRIPADLSVIGYDDIALASYSNPRLTTMAQPKSYMGQRIVSVLLERIVGSPLPLRRELLQTQLVTRQSTGAPPESPPRV
ncbi:LacI family transcriptional regulator, partial [Halobellus sp. Atlit-31R]